MPLFNQRSRVHPFPGLAAACCLLVCAMMTGCGFDSTYSGDCTKQQYVSAGNSRGDASYTLAPTGASSFTMYPGQTVTLPFHVTPVNSSTGSVSIFAAGLPFGLTMAPVTAQVGSDVNLTFTSTTALGTECFKGLTQIYTAHSTIAIQGGGASGATGGNAFGMDLEMVLENPSFKPASTNLPTLDVETASNAAVDSEDNYVSGTMTLVDAANKKYNYTGSITIKGHGNTTWIMPKKPYRLKLASKSALLGMPSEKNWVLLANYDDKTMLRDSLASELSNIAGLPWAPRSAYVELTLNGEYEGTYQLIENIDINSNRVNVADSDTDDTNPLANGYLMEIDQRQGDTYNWVTPHGIYVGSDDPDPPTDAEETYIHDLVNTSEASFYAGSGSSGTGGWRLHWNEDSVVDWFLVNELMGNEDAKAFSSDYFYKDAGDSPFFMGPVWDFDVSSGNDNYGAIKDPTVPWVRVTHPWYAELFTDPLFVTAVQNRWKAIRPQIDTVPAYIDTNAAALQVSANNNFQRWPILWQRVWPNAQVSGSYTGEVTYLKSWLAKRVAYMDSNYLK